MITHSDEEIEEHLATLLHLNLHGATSLESAAAADDESEEMSTKLGVVVRCVGIGPAS